MFSIRYYLYIIIETVLGVLICIAYCALVEVSKVKEHEQNQGEHDADETSTEREK